MPIRSSDLWPLLISMLCFGKAGDQGKEFDEGLEHSLVDGTCSNMIVRVFFPIVFDNVSEASCDVVHALFPWKSSCLFLTSDKNATNLFLIWVILNFSVST